MNKYLKNLRGKYTYIFSTILLISFSSMFVHEFMLEVIKVPYPREVGVPPIITIISQLIRYLTFAFVCTKYLYYRNKIPRSKAAIIAAILMLMLHETIRSFLIEGVIFHNFLYAFLHALPRLTVMITASIIVAYLSFSGVNYFFLIVTVVLVAVSSYFFQNFLVTSIEPYISALGSLQPIYSEPYPILFRIIIYVTFIETTVSVFIFAFIVWPMLDRTFSKKAVIFIFVILLLRGRLYGLLVLSHWIKQPTFIALLSESQFFFETLLCSLMVVLVCKTFFLNQTNTMRVKL